MEGNTNKTGSKGIAYYTGNVSNCICFLKGREKRQLGAASIILELPNEVRCGRAHVFSSLPPHYSACETSTAMADKRTSTW